MYPDGGVARLRVHGEARPDPRFLRLGLLDLAALENGGLVLDCSNRFYSSPQNLIFPGIAKVMGDGWETARRRDDGNDWVLIRLAGPGGVKMVEVDTSYFLGNSPGAAAVTGIAADGTTVELLPRTELLPDTRHRFLVDPEATAVDRGPAGHLPRRRAGPAAGVGRADVSDYPRDMVGYGPHPPDPHWPGGAKIAVQFVLNYEEGAENSVLHGDPASETFLSEIDAAPSRFRNRHMSMESLYEYGSRAGLWRVLRIFERRGLPLTIFGGGRWRWQRNPEAVAAFLRPRPRDRLPRPALDQSIS